MMFVEMSDSQADLLLILARDEARSIESGHITYDEPMEVLEDLYAILEQLANAGAS
jgi:hypothetical protein